MKVTLGFKFETRHKIWL